MIRDTWRAVLVVAVCCLLREVFEERRQPPPPPIVATQMPPAWQPAPVWVPQPEPPRPLRRVGAAFVELADSVIGVVRR